MINIKQFNKTRSTYAKYINETLLKVPVLSVNQKYNEEVLLGFFDILGIGIEKIHSNGGKLFVIDGKHKVNIVSGWMKNYGALNYEEQVKNFNKISREVYSILCDEWVNENVISIGYDFNFGDDGEIDLKNSFFAIINSKKKILLTDFEGKKSKNTKTIRMNYNPIRKLNETKTKTDFTMKLINDETVTGRLISLKSIDTASKELKKYLEDYVEDSGDYLNEFSSSIEKTFPIKINEKEREKEIKVNEERILYIKNRDGEFVARVKENFFKTTDGSCEECGFSFVKETGKNYIELHHKEKFAESVSLNKEYNSLSDVSEDFEFLCSNCHTKRHL